MSSLTLPALTDIAAEIVEGSPLADKIPENMRDQLIEELADCLQMTADCWIDETEERF